MKTIKPDDDWIAFPSAVHVALHPLASTDVARNSYRSFINYLKFQESMMENLETIKSRKVFKHKLQADSEYNGNIR